MEVEPRIGTSFVRWVPLDQLKEKTNQSEAIKLVKNTQPPAEGGKSCRTLAFVAPEPFRGEIFFPKASWTKYMTIPQISEKPDALSLVNRYTWLQTRFNSFNLGCFWGIFHFSQRELFLRLHGLVLFYTQGVWTSPVEVNAWEKLQHQQGDCKVYMGTDIFNLESEMWSSQ